ncbi:MAG TPA: hypothetical protein VGJ97_02895 [Anaerolineaceae bacterium]|jgi:hypothetical protein
MIFSEHGYPSILTGEYGYFQAVLQMGFLAAHEQMLVELKTWLWDHKRYQTPFAEALEAYQVHRSFTRLVLSDRETPCTLRELDRLFGEVFGFSGRSVVEGSLPWARQAVEISGGSRLPAPSFQRGARSEAVRAIGAD